MTLLALALVLFAALCHASWNLLAKRGAGGIAFTWLFSALSALLYAPLAVLLWWFQRPQIGALALLFILGSAILHIGYFGFLQLGYQRGDMSLVYPLARGVSPLLTTLFAVAVLGERMTVAAGVGVLLVAAGAVWLSYSASDTTNRSGLAAGLSGPVGLGILTAALIASYTLWDRHAVSVLLIPPLIYDWGCNALRSLALTPFAMRDRNRLRELWRQYRIEIVGIAVLSPLAYILVLTAMTFTQVSYVAPAREISILFGTFMGVRLLREGNMRARLLAAGSMVCGLVLLVLN